MRATFIPARANSRICSWVVVAGPSVHTIFALRMPLTLPELRKQHTHANGCNNHKMITGQIGRNGPKSLIYQAFGTVHAMHHTHASAVSLQNQLRGFTTESAKGLLPGPEREARSQCH